MGNLKVGDKVFLTEENQTGVFVSKDVNGLNNIKLDSGEIKQIADELIVLWKSLKFFYRLIISIFKKRK